MHDVRDHDKLLSLPCHCCHLHFYLTLASRVKMAASKGISKIKGHSSSTAYPQPEGNLAEVMLRFGPEFGAHSAYGRGSICLHSRFSIPNEILVI